MFIEQTNEKVFLLSSPWIVAKCIHSLRWKAHLF